MLTYDGLHSNRPCNNGPVEHTDGLDGGGMMRQYCAVVETLSELKRHAITSGVILEEYVELMVSIALKEFEELERLAEIGMATERAFNYKPKQEGAYNIFALGELHEESEFAFYSVETLLEWLEWAKGVE